MGNDLTIEIIYIRTETYFRRSIFKDAGFFPLQTSTGGIVISIRMSMILAHSSKHPRYFRRRHSHKWIRRSLLCGARVSRATDPSRLYDNVLIRCFSNTARLVDRCKFLCPMAASGQPSMRPLAIDHHHGRRIFEKLQGTATIVLLKLNPRSSAIAKQFRFFNLCALFWREIVISIQPPSALTHWPFQEYHPLPWIT